jgi:PDZ domain-containing protein
VLWWILGGAAGAIGFAAGVAAIVEVPYYTISPGSVWPTEELISVEGGESFPSAGEIGFTTVSVSDGRTSALEYFLGSIDPAVETVPEDELLGDQTPEENRERNRQMMSDSQQQATALAFETLGYEVAVPYGARVLQVDPNFPAGGLLAPGDLIVGAEGEPIESWEDLVAVLEPLGVDDEVTLEVAPAPDELDEPVVTEETLPDAELETVTVGLAEFDDPDDDQPPRAIMGVVGDTAVTFDFPFDVTIDAGQVGGPSAGLAFTLAILDVLTPEDLTGGESVATTGTISFDGTVGPVGGVRQKVYAARRAGVELFLVPSVEYDEAVAAADGDMRVEAVDTLDEALVALETIGGETQALQADAEAQPD